MQYISHLSDKEYTVISAVCQALSFGGSAFAAPSARLKPPSVRQSRRFLYLIFGSELEAFFFRFLNQSPFDDFVFRNVVGGVAVFLYHFGDKGKQRRQDGSLFRRFCFLVFEQRRIHGRTNAHQLFRIDLYFRKAP